MVSSRFPSAAEGDGTYTVVERLFGVGSVRQVGGHVEDRRALRMLCGGKRVRDGVCEGSVPRPQVCLWSLLSISHRDRDFATQNRTRSALSKVSVRSVAHIVPPFARPREIIIDVYGYSRGRCKRTSRRSGLIV